MAASSIGTITQDLQSNIISILNTDTTSITFTYRDGTTGTSSLSTFRIVDGLPLELLRGTGMPTVIVHTPEENTERLTAGYTPQYKSVMEVHIQVFDKQEGNVRLIADRIRARLISQLSTLRAKNFTVFYPGGSMRNSIVQQFLPDSNERVWINNIFLSARWFGD